MNLVEFIHNFKEEQTCIDYLIELRWPNGMICPFCNSKKTPYKLNDGKFKCANYKLCGQRIKSTTATVFEGTHISLDKWFYIIYQYAINKKSTSSLQVGRDFGISNHTAWSAGHRIRNVFSDEGLYKLSGVVEVDEVFLSRDKIGRWGAISTRKQPIIGMIERGGKVIVRCVNDRFEKTLTNLILKYVEPESTIYTDSWLGYKNLDKYYFHEWVNHKEREYVRGTTHTNNIEGFWAIMKRSIRGAHHTISPKHAQIYCDQITFLFNRRHLTPIERFDEILLRCINYKKPVNQSELAA